MGVTPLRAIISRFSLSFSHAVVEAVLCERPFAFLGIIAKGATPHFFSALPVHQQEWFDSGAVRSCQYRGVDWSALLPLDEELLDRLHACEILFMETVCRLEWKRAIPYATRRQWYLHHLRFWNDYLTRHRINLYLSAWLPHEIPDVILYHLCKLRGIPTLYLHMSTERDTAFLERNIEASAVQIGERHEELHQKYVEVGDVRSIPLCAEFEERYRALTAQEGQTIPLELGGVSMYTTTWQCAYQLLRSQPLRLVLQLGRSSSPRGIVSALRTLRRRRVIRERDAFYDTHAVEPDFSMPYVYFPLHLQPEASTVPMGGAFSDQIVAAQLLAALLPPGVLVYVKEHYKPSSWLGRTEQDYRDLLALPAVRLVRRDVNTFALREHCRAVATISGSPGFEGLFRGKPCFMFGHRFYQYAQGVYRIHSCDDLRRAVTEVFGEGRVPTLYDCRLYLKAMEETRVHGTVNPWDKKVSHLSDAEHIRANSRAILEELGRMEAGIAAEGSCGKGVP